MSSVRSRNTKPELFVRKYLYSKNIRFRLKKKALPCKPDIIISKINFVVFVHGCFWHGHKNCNRSRAPKSNVSYWRPKLEKNIKRGLTQAANDLGYESGIKNLMYHLYKKHSPLGSKIKGLAEVYEQMNTSQYKRAVTIYKNKRR